MSTQIYIETTFAASGSLPGLGSWYVRVNNGDGPQQVLLGSLPMMADETQARAIIHSLRSLDCATSGDITVHAQDTPEMWNIAYPGGTAQVWQDAAQLVDELDVTLCALNEDGLVGWLSGSVLAVGRQECPQIVEIH